MDFGAWIGYDRDNDEIKPTRYVDNMDFMFEAARQLGTDFKLLLTPEYSVHPMEVAVPHMVKRYYDHPNTMRHEDKMVLSSYGVPPQRMTPILEKLQQQGYEVAFMPFFGVGRHEMSESVEHTLRMLQRDDLIGMWRFVTDDSVRGCIRTNANMARAALFADKLYMAGVSPHYNSANVRDMHGIQGYGAVWKGIIRDDADWVEIVTWNDYNEDTNLMHYKWKRDWDKQLYNRDGAYLDATAHYISWYKTGRRPPITQDKIYFAYRDRSKWIARAWHGKEKKWKQHTMGKWPFTQIHDDVLDRVYFSTFLTAPAELTVRIGSAEKTVEAPAGVHHDWMPMQPGVPRFVLKRRGETVLDVLGRRTIIGEPTRENSTYFGSHLPSRIWAGAAVAGASRRVEAEDGEASGGAGTQDLNGVGAVHLPTKPGAALQFPVEGLKDGMHNIRFRYSNPHDYDRRVTLYADGVEREGPREKYRIPLWLPPTGRGQWRTATLMWSLYGKTTHLRIECNRKPEGEEVRRPGWNDTADVLIDAVELVRVDPAEFFGPEESIYPDMVRVPGGRFVMGNDGSTEKDERPAHKVSVSPFYIGKFEVTNEQFERFWPEHRKWRDGYSWRDDEPVIYVSWQDAARYCNWLSDQAGLERVYDEDQWTTDRSANGFRLPTEAEWEYVASGRDQGRTYPWGDEEPEPMVQGNFAGREVVEVPDHMRSQHAQGVVTVGSFPRGASRDGVMDLAGNVAEWCSDWYQMYGEGAKTDPLETRESHSRVIRGGSWGYYGYSQRAADREFNSPVYPGYIFVGFRVALPEAGWQKMRD
jgi:formylglycine-generating enzyme required for sulfatase activity